MAAPKRRPSSTSPSCIGKNILFGVCARPPCLRTRSPRISWKPSANRGREFASAYVREPKANGRSSAMFSDIAQMRNEMEAASDEQEVRLITEKIGSLLRMLRDHGFPILQASQQGPNAEQAFDSTYDPEGLEKIVRLEALLDARIAKVLARLVGLKEFKRTPAAGTTTMMLPAVQNR